MKAAVIDLGTNTFHLIIAEITSTGLEVIYKTTVPVKLGEGRINENIIIPAAFERGIATLQDFKATIAEHRADVVRAIATSAVRSAANGKDFTDGARERAGINIEVITGDQEAAFIFAGVKATGVIKDTSLIMDIGGGSTEFIICTPEKALWKRSYNIGAARLMQAYFHSDPISEKDQSDIISRLEEELFELKEACLLHHPTVLIGSAGAFETFAGMLHTTPDRTQLPATAMDLAAYKLLAEKLIRSSHAEREAMPDLVPLRVDLIVIASLITNYVLETMALKAISVSTYDLKMGVLFTIYEDQKSSSAE